MAQRIGNQPIGFIRNVDFNLDVPALLGILATSEEHIKHVQAIQLFSNLLDAVAKKSIEIRDPGLLDLMFKMKLLSVVNNEGDHYGDI